MATTRWLTFAVLLILGAAPGGAQTGVERFEDLSRAIRGVYERVAPAVVLIQTSGDISDRLPRFHPRLDPEDGGEFSGLGSGVIVSAEGYILSNHHVVRGADSIQVTLHDRRRYPARVVGVDSLIDIALLEIDAEDLPVATLGQSDGLLIGDWVLAIGYPLGMGTTLTHGIISALGRQAEVIQARYKIESFIQTNAVINPGNSGGPLLDLHGRVIGVNTAISTKTGYFMGYGLAVPIDLAREAMDDFLTYGRVVRGYLGITMLEVDAQLASRYGIQLHPPRGVYVDRIEVGAPADHSDLAIGDVVLAVDGRPVNEANEVQTLIYGRDPGEAVMLAVYRDGAERTVRVILGEREQDQLLALGQRRVQALGLTVATIDAEQAERLGFTQEVARQLEYGDDDEALVVIAVDPEGPAAAKGIRVDDIITEVDRTGVSSLEGFARSVSRLEAGKSALFWLWRREGGIDVRALRIDASPEVDR